MRVETALGVMLDRANPMVKVVRLRAVMLMRWRRLAPVVAATGLPAGEQEVVRRRKAALPEGMSEVLAQEDLAPSRRVPCQQQTGPRSGRWTMGGPWVDTAE